MTVLYGTHGVSATRIQRPGQQLPAQRRHLRAGHSGRRPTDRRRSANGTLVGSATGTNWYNSGVQILKGATGSGAWGVSGSNVLTIQSKNNSGVAFYVNSSAAGNLVNEFNGVVKVAAGDTGCFVATTLKPRASRVSSNSTTSNCTTARPST